ncbi:DNA replication protein DnaD [Paraliobacillus sp. PM-2]|uniref:DnaD domain-containing protein n=1 Tax=Paraliobacillus sp. PM-2 TaxID=1462524 RepID=UPI00061BF863|nr:DnaD domain protein [Paraliobacillus sp. PM-2]CQR46587.1 DNA replication protein DnaD [Paraliobacillus sp. PM-2]
MNYIKELNAFKEWMSFHEIPPNAVLLWHTLMVLNNTARWMETFNAPNSIIGNLSGLSSQRIAESRKVLVENELIHYEPGVKGKAASYQMKSLVSYFENLSQASGGQFQMRNTEPNAEPFGNETRDIHKEKEIAKQRRRGGGKEQNAYTVYEHNFGMIKPIVRESLLAWCDDLGDAMVIEAIQLAVKKGGRTYSYLEAILKEWVQAGITPLEQARNYQLQKKGARSTPLLVKDKSKNREVLDKIRREMQS